jgi:hypothetical protein
MIVKTIQKSTEQFETCQAAMGQGEEGRQVLVALASWVRWFCHGTAAVATPFAGFGWLGRNAIWAGKRWY